MSVPIQTYRVNRSPSDGHKTWMEFKNCKGVSLDIMIPQEKLDDLSPDPTWESNVEKARSYCATCMVAEPCLQYGLHLARTVEDCAIYGGTTRLERAEMVGIEMYYEPEMIEHQKHRKCGSIAGYKYHRRQGEPACDECKIAFAAYNRERYWKNRPTPPDSDNTASEAA